MPDSQLHQSPGCGRTHVDPISCVVFIMETPVGPKSRAEQSIKQYLCPRYPGIWGKAEENCGLAELFNGEE